MAIFTNDELRQIAATFMRAKSRQVGEVFNMTRADAQTLIMEYHTQLETFRTELVASLPQSVRDEMTVADYLRLLELFVTAWARKQGV